MIFAAPFTAAAPAGDRNLTSEELIRVGAVVVQDPPGRSLCGDVGGVGVEDSRFIVMSSPLASLAYSVAGSFGLAVNLTLTRAAGFSSCMGKANFSKKPSNQPSSMGRQRPIPASRGMPDAGFGHVPALAIHDDRSLQRAGQVGDRRLPRANRGVPRPVRGRAHGRPPR